MPNHQVHNLISRLFLGKDSTNTNFIIDYPAGNPIWHTEKQKGKEVLVFSPLGPSHRSFGHDPLSAALIGLISGEGPEVGIMHYATDQLFDELEKAAKQQVKQNPQGQQDPILAALQKLLFPEGQHINQKNKPKAVDPMTQFLQALGMLPK